MGAKMYYIRPFGLLGGRYRVDRAGWKLQIANWIFAVISGLAFAVALSENLLTGFAGAVASVLYVLVVFFVCLKISIVVMERGVREES